MMSHDVTGLTSKSVLIRTREEPERNSLMMSSLSFCSMSPCCAQGGEQGRERGGRGGQRMRDRVRGQRRGRKRERAKGHKDLCIYVQ